jgi:hypothetical protein
MLIPKGGLASATLSSQDRTKLPRLCGADLHVARLGWKPPDSSLESIPCYMVPHTDVEANPSPRVATGSLYEELWNPHIQPRPDTTTTDKPGEKHPSVLSLRPCYRCITYISSVGIKRVFWTTSTGAWECAKVRDLVDAMDNVGLGQPSNVATMLSNVFFTKHEVLMLRRTMG